MKKSTFASVAFPAGLAFAVLGCAAGADPSAGEARGTPPDPQQRIASTTLALEKAFDVQFVKGQVDRDSLQPLVYDVLQAMPDDMRPRVESHIYDVIARGQKDAAEMTPDQRAQIAAPVSADKLGPQQVEIIGAWGWGGPAFGGAGYGLGYGGLGYGAGYGAGYGLGWGGLGAFGFPGSFGGWGW